MSLADFVIAASGLLCAASVALGVAAAVRRSFVLLRYAAALGTVGLIGMCVAATLVGGLLAAGFFPGMAVGLALIWWGCRGEARPDQQSADRNGETCG